MTNLNFRKEIVANSKSKEVYIYFQGRLIYKQWQENGRKIASRMFHEGEGLTQFAK